MKFLFASLLIVFASTLSAHAAGETDRLKNVSFSTRGSILLMPCMDKSGNQMTGFSQSAVKDDFCTETMNQVIRDGGAKTVSWFKVNSMMKKILNPTNTQSTSNPFVSSSSMLGGVSRQDYTNDMYIIELIEAAKRLRAKYIVRPVVLNKNAGATSTMKQGFFSFKNEIEKNANVTLKVDVISVSEEDIIGTRSFEGSFNSTEVKRGLMTSGSIMLDSPYKSALSEAIFKSVDYISERMR